MNVLARTTVTAAAKCGKHCELQDSVNHQKFERISSVGLFLKACFLSVFTVCLSRVYVCGSGVFFL